MVNVMMMIVWCQCNVIHVIMRPWCAFVIIDHNVDNHVIVDWCMIMMSWCYTWMQM